MVFILGTLGDGRCFIVGVLVVVGHFYPGSSADLVDWKPTRSPEVEAQNEIDDVRQMIEAQNEMRRRRGAPELTEQELREKVAAEERDRLRRRALRDELSVARALIVGCGCRGRRLGSGCSPRAGRCAARAAREEGLAAIEAAGIEPALADPDRPGVSAPPPFGGSARSIVVTLDPQRLQSYGMSPEEVVTAVTKGNSISPSGNLLVGDKYPIVSSTRS